MFPNRAHMERDTCLQGIFTSFLIYLFISKAVRQERPSMFPKRGAPMERDTNLQSLLYLSPRVPSKGALPPGSLHKAPIERGTPPHPTPPPKPLSVISQIRRCAMTRYCKVFLYKNTKYNALLNLIELLLPV